MIMYGSVRRAWSKLFGKYLWVTNTLSSGGLLAVGDGIQQQIERVRGVNSSPGYDWKRTGRLFLIGLSLGPPHHIFYIWLDKILPQKNAKTVFKKVMADQILAAPIFAVIFFLGAGLLEGKALKVAWLEFKEKFPVVYAFDWCIWPPTQAINFFYVPIQYRVLYINGVTVIWDIFLSYMKHKDQAVDTNEKIPSKSS